MTGKKHNRDFKSIVVGVCDEVKKAAMAQLILEGSKPTFRNMAELLRNWAAAGIKDRSASLLVKRNLTPTTKH